MRIKLHLFPGDKLSFHVSKEECRIQCMIPTQTIFIAVTKFLFITKITKWEGMLFVCLGTFTGPGGRTQAPHVFSVGNDNF